MGTLRSSKNERGIYDIVERWVPRLRRVDNRQLVSEGDVHITILDDGCLSAVMELPNGMAVECNIEMNTGFPDIDNDYVYEGDIVALRGKHYYVTLAGALGQWNLCNVNDDRKEHSLCDVHDKCIIVRNIDDRTFEERCDEWAEKEGE